MATLASLEDIASDTSVLDIKLKFLAVLCPDLTDHSNLCHRICSHAFSDDSPDYIIPTINKPGLTLK